ncbi:UPF0561 protein C2orf68 homolog isoform X2 [Pogoniulus pusillus]|uniref:UPF0561 protein C2orf68 homolog isoform X2 n=1 Tax=Pogoniulus pusillus TaxID=488313 RepID=UPI0030B93665
MEAAVDWRCRPGGRLDMSHGFVRHIRHNQIARDAYERAVRQARGRARGRLPPATPRPRRPDQQVYRPRRNGGQRRGGDPQAVCPLPAGACPAPCPVPTCPGRAQQAPGDRLRLLPPAGHCWALLLGTAAATCCQLLGTAAATCWALLGTAAASCWAPVPAAARCQ